MTWKDYFNLEAVAERCLGKEQFWNTVSSAVYRCFSVLRIWIGVSLEVSTPPLKIHPPILRQQHQIFFGIPLPGVAPHSTEIFLVATPLPLKKNSFIFDNCSVTLKKTFKSMVKIESKKLRYFSSQRNS